MFSFIKRNKETSQKQNSSADLPENFEQKHSPEHDSSLQPEHSPEFVTSPALRFIGVGESMMISGYLMPKSLSGVLYEPELAGRLVS